MKNSRKLADDVRDSLFLAPSRTYAEKYMEPILREKFSLLKPTSGDHDAISTESHKFEIKAARVLKDLSKAKKSKTFLEKILSEKSGLVLERLVPFSEARTASYNANFQNVKRDHFDQLVYCMLFSDVIKIFQAPKAKINTKDFKNWSDKHGRYDAIGKSGQFPIGPQNVDWHLDRYLIADLTYVEVVAIAQRLSK